MTAQTGQECVKTVVRPGGVSEVLMLSCTDEILSKELAVTYTSGTTPRSHGTNEQGGRPYLGHYDCEITRCTQHPNLADSHTWLQLVSSESPSSKLPKKENWRTLPLSARIARGLIAARV